MEKTAVAVIPINSYSEEVVVGHVPKNMSKIVFMFLPLPHCALDIFVTGKRVNCRGGYGLEIPANFYFYGPEKAINWLKNKVNKIEEKLKENVKHCLKLNIEKLLVSAIERSFLGGNVNQDLKMKSTMKCPPHRGFVMRV